MLNNVLTELATASSRRMREAFFTFLACTVQTTVIRRIDITMLVFILIQIQYRYTEMTFDVLNVLTTVGGAGTPYSYDVIAAVMLVSGLVALLFSFLSSSVRGTPVNLVLMKDGISKVNQQ